MTAQVRTSQTERAARRVSAMATRIRQMRGITLSERHEMPSIGTNQSFLHLHNRGGFPSIDAMIDGIAAQGLTVFEICPESPALTVEVFTPQMRRHALGRMQRLGMDAILHASFMTADITFLNNQVRQAAVDLLKREIELAHDLQAGAVTIHPGVPSVHLQWYPHEDYWSLLLDSYGELVEHARRLGVRICTENISPHWVGTEGQIARLLDSFDPGCFGLTFDIAHNHLIHRHLPPEERTATAISILKRFCNRIWVLHIHDNAGERDEHLGVGMGNIDYQTILPAVLQNEIDAFWSIEVNEPAHLKQSRDAIMRFISG